jgi:hypothetical protein
MLTGNARVPGGKPVPVPLCSPQALYVFGLGLIPGVLGERWASD